MSGKKLDYLGVSAFCESMAMMVQAGIQTDEAITLLQSERTHSSGILEEGLSIMKEQVDQGFGLAAAMKEIQTPITNCQMRQVDPIGRYVIVFLKFKG